MARLILNDGTERSVDYNQAAKLYQTLIGNREPDSEAEYELCCIVREVQFDAVTTKPKVDFKQRFQQYLHDHDIDLAHPKHVEQPPEYAIRLPYKG